MRAPSRGTPIEAEIQTLIGNGEFDEACAKAWDAYQGEIRASCIRRLYGRVNNPEADGEDVAQDVFIAFCISLPRNYAPSKGTVHDYLIGIMQHCITNKLRTLNRGISFHDTLLHELQRRDLSRPLSKNPEMILLTQEGVKLLEQDVERVKRALDKLPPRYREVIKCYHLLGHSVAEIADLEGEKAGTIRTRLVRARTELREEIYRDEDSFIFREQAGLYAELRVYYAFNKEVIKILIDLHNYNPGYLARIKSRIWRFENTFIGFLVKLKSASRFIICQCCQYVVHSLLEYIEALFMRK